MAAIQSNVLRRTGLKYGYARPSNKGAVTVFCVGATAIQIGYLVRLLVAADDHRVTLKSGASNAHGMAFDGGLLSHSQAQTALQSIITPTYIS